MRWDFDDDVIPVPGQQVLGYLRVFELEHGCRVEVHQCAADALNRPSSYGGLADGAGPVHAVRRDGPRTPREHRPKHRPTGARIFRSGRGPLLPLTREGPAPREHPSGRRRDRSRRAATRSSCAPAPSPRTSWSSALRRRPAARDPLQHPPHAAGARGGHRPGRGRLLLHRHQPGRPGRGRRARHRGLQRALLQHPQRRRAGDRRDHRAGPAAAREDPEDARGRLGQVGQGQPRDPRPDARHRRLRQHRHPALQRRRGARAAGRSSTTPPTGSRTATPAGCARLDALLAEADVVIAARRRPARATPGSSAPSSSRG